MREQTADPNRGLSRAEVEERIARGLDNDVPAVPTRTLPEIVRANVLTRFNAILGSMLAVILIVGQLQDALFGVVLVANSVIGIVQELRAKRTLERLTLLAGVRPRVVREGRVEEVELGALVLGDILDLRAGDHVPVDARVIVTTGLEIDESLITGESEPIAKRPGDEVLSGSIVVTGSGRASAARVGHDAYAARIAADVKRFTLTRSALRAGIDRLLVVVTFLLVPTATLLFASQLRAREGWRDAISGSVAGTVAMVPEGLVLLTSVAFAAAVLRLGRQGVLVRELPAVEGLARVDVVCIDKTGTLTQGRLEVDRVERLDEDDPAPALAALAASDPAPNATMAAIRARFGVVPDGWEVRSVVPFSSARGWSGAAIEGRGAWILGAPDVVVRDPATREQLERSAAGGRVLILGHAERLDGERLPERVRPAAAVVLADRPRPDAARTLRYFADQGVRVIVLSGDHPATVGAIAAAVGVPGGDEPVDAREVTDEGLVELLGSRTVFGRVTPQRKRLLVRALQERGHTVAMTGDGINDALALKDADVGVAMGSGSDATRAVAQLVLLDSSFAALPSIVAEGRRVLGNIERTAALYLTKTVYAMVLAVAVGVAGWVFPFLPRHLTLIGAVTIGIPSFFLALAPGGERFRPGFVGRVLRVAVPAGVLAATATFLAYGLAGDELDITLEQQRTTAVMVLAFVAFGVLSIVAAPLTAGRLALILSMVATFVFALALPASRRFFALDPPPTIVWLAGVGIAGIVWSLARLFVPASRPVGPAPPSPPSPPTPG